MAHFGNKSDNCKTCIPFNGFKFISIIVAGSVIGFAASQFVEPPPSVKLLLNSKHNQDTSDIMMKLDAMDKNVLSIKSDIFYIKQRFEQKQKANEEK